MLEPGPIDLDVKVILVGERILYYLLAQYDPDFSELFKVQVDFDDEFERSDDNVHLYARLIATIAAREQLKALNAAACAALIDESSRMAADSQRLSLQVGRLSELMSQADHWAGVAGRKHIGAVDVARAITEQTRRASRLHENFQQAVARNILLIDTDGEKIGQINGLSVVQFGGSAFGRPSRITARVRVGSGQIIDIERETKLGGPLHSKGVLILSSYLAANYALNAPMCLWASLVFEQSYGGVDGDSASSAELYALLSALSGVPILQSYAVTGSVNQLGEVQAIGAVSEKIEGFFDICQARGLNGRQGVLIPQSNVVHLVLRPRVIDAVRAGQFQIHAIANVHEGIERLTGLPAGARDDGGAFPEGSINARVEARLQQFAVTRRSYGANKDEHDDGAKQSG
jgi:predicted ATP-dependent protease